MSIRKKTIKLFAAASIAFLLLPVSAAANSHGENQPPKGSFAWECNKTITKNDGPPAVVVTDDEYASFVEFFLDGHSIGSAWQSQSENTPPSTRTIVPREWDISTLKEGQHKLSAEVMDRNAATTWALSSCANSLELIFHIPYAPPPPPIVVNPPVNIEESILVCSRRLDAVTKTITKITNRLDSNYKHAASVQQKIEDFHTRSNNEVQNYESLYDSAEKAHKNVGDSNLLLKQKSIIDCEHDLNLQIREYRDQLGKTKESLRAYKQTLKDLIKAVGGE